MGYLEDRKRDRLEALAVRLGGKWQVCGVLAPDRRLPCVILPFTWQYFRT